MFFMRRFLTASIIGLVFWAVLSSAVVLPSPDQVTIDTGQLKGVIAGDVVSFKGIPYAAPPIGDLRWRAPQPAKSWTGVRLADHFSNDCMQKPFPGDAAPLSQPLSEDCLGINVWAPVKKTGKLAVLVWIHGGGYVNGAGSAEVYDGSQLARLGIILVSMNYRLGRFGFFAHPALTAESPDGPLGNYGYLDQIAALKWIQKNIAAFGGDPANVTIFGESAGGGSVNALMVSPLAQGLFHKVICDSGGGRPGGLLSMKGIREVGALGQPSPEQVGKAFAVSMGIKGDDAESLKALRVLPAEKILNNLSMAAMQQETYSGPMADGRIVPADPGVIFQQGKQAKVPYLVGANSYELGSFPLPPAVTTGTLASFGPAADAIAATYDPQKTGDKNELNHNLISDVSFVEPARYMATLVTAIGQPAYLYRFSYVPEHLRAGLPGAPHATELPFVFDTVKARYGDKATEKDEATGRAMSRYYANFAKKGNPNGDGLPAWPVYSPSADQLMDFTNDGPVSKVNPVKARLDAIAAGQKK
jgi:para-nitrobenzyl esterase